jgi:hypothetical protein
MGQDTILIVDALNYIKGLRYQLYCAAREFKLRVCTVSTRVIPNQMATDMMRRRGYWFLSTVCQLSGASRRIAYLLRTDLNPHWDEIIYIPVPSLKETLLLEVMDYQNLTKDRSLGTVELKVSELAQELPKGTDNPSFSFEPTGRKEQSEPIRLERGNQYKGHLRYVAESTFLRLRHTKLGLDDFQTVKVIGKGAFGEVRTDSGPFSFSSCLTTGVTTGPTGAED